MSKRLTCIAFYNVENLFHFEDTSTKRDKDFTPKGKKKWGAYRYNIKTEKIGKAIAQIGGKHTNDVPEIIGLAEIENEKVLEDLINSSALKEKKYDYVFFNSEDKRGINTAFLYRTDKFSISKTACIEIPFFKTRAIIYVEGKLDNENIHLYINHWPSNRKVSENSNPGRKDIAQIVLEHSKNIKEESPKIIFMGDFNSNPDSESISKILTGNSFLNTSKNLFDNKQGTTKFYGKWMLFDQFLLSQDFFKEDSKLKHRSTHIFNPPFLTNKMGRFKNEPLRTYTGRYYLGGYSDHYPTYILLEKNT